MKLPIIETTIFIIIISFRIYNNYKEKNALLKFDKYIIIFIIAYVISILRYFY